MRGSLRQLGVERRDQHAAVAQQHWLTVALGEHLDAGPDVADTRRADEHPSERAVLAFDLQVRLEARNLAAVGVPLDLEVGQTEVRPVEQDHPRAGAEDRPLERRGSPRRARRAPPAS